MGPFIRSVVRIWLVGAVLVAGQFMPAAAQSRLPEGAHTFTLGRGAFLLDGAPLQIRAGAIHYARVPRAYWRGRLRMARAMGLNAVTTYVFWNVQEPDSGRFDFTGRADIAAFVRTAQEEGLWVILRPGPYVCAEWDFGGFPWWLLRDSTITVRSRSPGFLRLAGDYLHRLGKELAPLQVTRGGPILMVQVENEYGSYGSDTTYMAAIRDLLRQSGFDVPLFTADGPSQMPSGHIAGALPAVNGATDSTIFESIRRFAPQGPFFVPEMYPGWLDHWGEAYQRVPTERIAHELDWVLAHGISFSLYMFHGGTNFGFMNGANFDGHYQPQLTSYDYDAPLDEAGRPTAKFYALRSVIARHLPPGDTLPSVPPVDPFIRIPRFRLAESASLWRVLGPGTRSEAPVPMEDLGEGYGYVAYRAKLTAGRGTLRIDGLRDYAVAFLDGTRIGTLDRRLHQRALELRVPRGGGTLDLLVENGGRINYGPLIPDNRQGIVGSVTFRGAPVRGWQNFTLPLRDPAHARFRPGPPSPPGTPALYRGTFTLTRTGDTFLDLRGWGKGAVWVNGHNLGRYWEIGPQQTLYLPGVWLHRGRNEIIVLDLDAPADRSVAGLTAPILDQLGPQAP